MGYIDASIGIKIWCNFLGYKNKLVLFEPPLSVLLDRIFISSLDEREIRNGVCEIVKTAIISDKKLFYMLSQHASICIKNKFQCKYSYDILKRCVKKTMKELKDNLYESKLSRSLDFGHTFSQQIEMRDENELLHGEAVIIDILISSFIAFNKKLLKQNELESILELIKNLDLFHNPYISNGELLIESFRERVLHRGGFQRLPLPFGIGRCRFLYDVSDSDIITAFKHYNGWILL